MFDIYFVKLSRVEAFDYVGTIIEILIQSR